MEEAMELEETNQKSISGVACTKIGNAYEKYVTENSAELIASSKQLTQCDKYGPAPLLEDGTLNPWPDNGTWEYSVIAFILQTHKEGRGYCGNSKMSLSAVKTVEGRLRSYAYHRCKLKCLIFHPKLPRHL